MGADVSFRYDFGSAQHHSFIDEEGDFAVFLGRVHFAGVTMGNQRKVYGIDWADCLTWGPDEMVGPKDNDDVAGWYTPDWDRALERVERLYAAFETTTNEGRRAYDAERLPTFRDLIRKCASHEDRQNCQVFISE